MCAGIGTLAFTISNQHDYWRDNPNAQITCVEINPDYVEVGKKILPEANWVLGSVLDEKLISSLGKFDQSISNPPFGRVQTDSTSWLNYRGPEFEFKVIEVASKISRDGAFILPQVSCPFELSGQPHFICKRHNGSLSSKLISFERDTGITLGHNIGIDTSCYRDQWRGVNITTEIVEVEFDYQDEPKEEITVTGNPQTEQMQLSF